MGVVGFCNLALEKGFVLGCVPPSAEVLRAVASVVRCAQVAMQQYNYQWPVYAKDPKDIPGRLYDTHRWLPPIDFNKLQKRQLKVRMCCTKCEEKVLEEIWEIPGVFDVRAYWMVNKVVVTAMPDPIGVDDDEVLRKARKIDCRARFVELDSSEIVVVNPGNTQTKPPKPPVKPVNGSTTTVQLIPQHGPQHGPQLHVPVYSPAYSYGYPSPSPGPYNEHRSDGNFPLLFLLFIILLVSMFVFRR